MELKEKLIELRGEKGWSQDDLALKLNVEVGARGGCAVYGKSGVHRKAVRRASGRTGERGTAM